MYSTKGWTFSCLPLRNRQLRTARLFRKVSSTNRTKGIWWKPDITGGRINLILKEKIMYT
jgi:hypothetical protein